MLHRVSCHHVLWWSSIHWRETLCNNQQFNHCIRSIIQDMERSKLTSTYFVFTFVNYIYIYKLYILVVKKTTKWLNVLLSWISEKSGSCLTTQRQKYRVCLNNKTIIPFAVVVYELITNSVYVQSRLRATLYIFPVRTD